MIQLVQRYLTLVRLAEQRQPHFLHKPNDLLMELAWAVETAENSFLGVEVRN